MKRSKTKIVRRSNANTNDGNGDATEPSPRRSTIATGIDKVKRVIKRVSALTEEDDDVTRPSRGGSGSNEKGSPPRSLHGSENSGEGFCHGVKDDSHQCQWDLDYCIDMIETLNIIDGISPEQRAAIQHLRSATVSTVSGENNFSGRASERQFQRRDAKFFALSMTKELVTCFHEVEDNKEDTDQQRNVTAVLANYGGDMFDNIFSFAPPSKKKKNRGIDVQVQIPEGEELLQSEFSAKESLTSLKDYVSETDRPDESSRREGTFVIDPALLSSPSIAEFVHSEPEPNLGSKVYCPPEWNALTKDARKELTRLLSWESLSQWDFNILNVADLSKQVMVGPSMTDLKEQFCPLLLVGWAILCAPMAQQAMEGSLGDNIKKETISPSNGKKSRPYHFDNIQIQPDNVCNFLREIENRYQANLPYHNNIHAADVTQTLHCLLQFLGEDMLNAIYGPVKIFSVLLAATFHDVGHPGANNLFQKNTRSQFAIRYNDASILENMHSYIGHSLLMGADKKHEWDVFKEWNDQDIDAARDVMMSSVLGTDMSNHFEAVGELATLVEKVYAQENDVEARKSLTTSSLQGENEQQSVLSILARVLDPTNNNEEEPLKKECSHLAKSILNFLMHASDISNPTKKLDLATYWADMALAEFFKQGDKEEELGIPISPLCDRHTVKRADSQIGFLKFVIRPTYKLLGEFVPRVKEEVMPIIDENIKYWTKEKSRQSMKLKMTQQEIRGP